MDSTTYDVTVSIYGTNRAKTLKHETTLSLGHMTRYESNQFALKIVQLNPTKKVVFSYSETFQFSSSETTENNV